MCFSAEASFLTATVTGLVGVATITRASNARELPLAAIPLLFAIQQAAEGGLWLTLPVAPQAGLSSFLTHVFLVFALAFWPVFAPLAAFLVEPSATRRRVMMVCLLIGIVVAGYFIGSVLTIPHIASINEGHIVYRTGASSPFSVGGLYLLATGVALLMSSHRAVSVTGWIVFLGSIASYYSYWEAFVSVWCFFAAASSIVLLVHFERARAGRQAKAAGA